MHIVYETNILDDIQRLYESRKRHRSVGHIELTQDERRDLADAIGYQYTIGDPPVCGIEVPVTNTLLYVGKPSVTTQTKVICK